MPKSSSSAVRLQEKFSASPVIPVLKIDEVSDAVPLANALYEGGFRVFEVTLRTPQAIPAMMQMREHLPDDAYVGVGTVLNEEQYLSASAAGAEFAVSPGVSPALMAAAMAGDVAWLPGCATPSEMLFLVEQGIDFVKFFPAAASGGVAALKAANAVLPELRFCPTGGISEASLRDYLSLPNVLCVGGSWMLPEGLIAAKDWSGIASLAAAAMVAAQSE